MTAPGAPVFDASFLLGFIPEIDVLPLKLGASPREEQRMLMGVIKRIVTTYLLTPRVEDGMNVPRPLKVR